MTKEEALVILELSPDAPVAAVKARLDEQKALLEDLSENAPSDFLRRLHGRKLSTIKNILQEYRQWQFDEPSQQLLPAATAETILPASIENSRSGDTESIVRSEPAGWLIIHTEDKPPASFAINAGANFIGRKQHPSLHPFIVIEDDAFISRLQCIIYAEENNTRFYLSDPSTFNNGKTSSNGTFLNGNNHPVTARQVLEDGDTVQLGITKLVFRTADAGIDQLVAEVAQLPYTPTVLLA
jgi:pSer/pThr/pTyr-binding forkhead associated (FHA) protein